MTELPLPIRPGDRLAHVFQSRAAAQGGVVRRQIRDIERIIGRARFLAEIERRGCRAVENAGQKIVFCNREPVRIVR